MYFNYVIVAQQAQLFFSPRLGRSKLLPFISELPNLYHCGGKLAQGAIIGGTSLRRGATLFV